MTKPKGSHPSLIINDEIVPSSFDEAFQSSCWSIWEGCACRHLKDHFGSHACADLKCNTTWTSEQADAWAADEAEARRTGGTVADRHRGNSDG